MIVFFVSLTIVKVAVLQRFHVIELKWSPLDICCLNGSVQMYVTFEKNSTPLWSFLPTKSERGAQFHVS